MALAGQQSVQPKPQVAPPTPQEMFEAGRQRLKEQSPARLQALIFGYNKVGKTSLCLTCEQSVDKPVWVDAFEANARQVLRSGIDAGTIIVDDRWATYDFARPSEMYDKYKRELELRVRNGFFENIGTFCVDSITTLSQFMFPWGEQETLRQGKTVKSGDPDIRSVYGNCQTELEKLCTRILSMPCDCLVMAHPDEKEREARQLITPQLIGRVKSPLGKFSEIWYMEAIPQKKDEPPLRRIMISTDGDYLAGSCLNTKRDMNQYQPPDIQAIKRAAGLL